MIFSGWLLFWLVRRKKKNPCKEIEMKITCKRQKWLYDAATLKNRMLRISIPKYRIRTRTGTRVKTRAKTMAEGKRHFLMNGNFAFSNALTRWDKSNRKRFKSFAEEPLPLSWRLVCFVLEYLRVRTSLIHVGKLLTTLCHRARFKSNNVNLHFGHRRPKLTIRGIDEILTIYVSVSSETWLL